MRVDCSLLHAPRSTDTAIALGILKGNVLSGREKGGLTKEGTQPSCTLFSVQITFLNFCQFSYNTEAFVDSGAVECFMDAHWARVWAVPI